MNSSKLSILSPKISLLSHFGHNKNFPKKKTKQLLSRKKFKEKLKSVDFRS